MSFSIGFLPEPVPNLEPGIKACIGQIKIGSFQEKFSASLMHWKPAQYEQHWSQAISRIISSSETSALITSMTNPTLENHIFWWPMYRVDNTIFVQNQILFFDQLASPFNENDPFVHVSQRTVLNEDGERISEWSVPLSELKMFWENNLRLYYSQ
jgi:hypothetical protein